MGPGTDALGTRQESRPLSARQDDHRHAGCRSLLQRRQRCGVPRLAAPGGCCVASGHAPGVVWRLTCLDLGCCATATRAMAAGAVKAGGRRIATKRRTVSVRVNQWRRERERVRERKRERERERRVRREEKQQRDTFTFLALSPFPPVAA